MNTRTPSSRRALRTLLTVLALAVGIVIYAYGWNTTEISLDEVKDEVRQASVQRAMRELLSPNIFTRDREDRNYTVTFQIGCPTGGQPDGRAETGEGPYIVFTPPCADVDEVITAEGFNFPADAIARIQLVSATGQKMPFKLATTSAEGETDVSEETVFDVDGAGHFLVELKVPKGRGLSGKTHTLEVQTLVPVGTPRLSETTKTVIDKMIETIFLALMATTLALPIAFVLSFIAARNLMRQVNMPLGNVLSGFVALPVGAVLGAVLLGPVGRAGIDLGKNAVSGLVAIPLAIAALALVTWAIGRLPQKKGWRRARGVLTNMLLLAVVIFVLGVLGGLGLWLGDHLQSGLLADLGNFVGTLGELVDLTIAALAGLAGGFWFASLGATLASGPLRHVSMPASHVLGAVLGALAGTILLSVTAYIGMQAVLLGILTPLVAAVLGGQIVVQVLEHMGVFPRNQWQTDQAVAERTVRMVAFFAGAVAVFILTALAIDLVRAVVDQRLPVGTTLDLGFATVTRYIGVSAIIGAVLGGVAGGLAGTHTTFPLGMTVYTSTRTVLNTLRSIEPLIMGIVFVIWVGVGPFAGVLALTLHSIAALGKLYSEQVENISQGPIEAIQSTGATRLQTVIYAVVPQIVPPYIAFTMYRWDINVRMSTIIGFVGGGGIGFLLQQQINLLRYRQAGVAVLAIAIVVSVLDYASAAIRERIV